MYRYVLVLVIILVIILLSRENWVNLDNNATTEMSFKTKLAMWRSPTYNPSASYAHREKEMIQDLKWAVSKMTNGGHVVITSGASEANNLVLRGVGPGHIIVSALEHKTSIRCAESLGKFDLAPPNKSGVVTWRQIEPLIKPDTCLVSVMYANNETGLINPVWDIARQCKYRGILFHCDAVQWFGKSVWAERCLFGPEMNQEFKDMDFISISMHKLHGPKGIGFLVCRAGVAPQICGSQNDGLRGGTENMPGIAASLAAIYENFTDRRRKNRHMADLIWRLRDGLGKSTRPPHHMAPFTSPRHFCPESVTPIHFTEYVGLTDEECEKKIIGRQNRWEVVFISAEPSSTWGLPNTLLVSFNINDKDQRICNIKIRDELTKLGIGVSIGSACNTTAKGSSHVLKALKLPFLVRCGTVRLSVGDFSSCRDINKFLYVLPMVLEKSILQK